MGNYNPIVRCDVIDFVDEFSSDSGYLFYMLNELIMYVDGVDEYISDNFM